MIIIIIIIDYPDREDKKENGEDKKENDIVLEKIKKIIKLTYHISCLIGYIVT